MIRNKGIENDSLERQINLISADVFEFSNKYESNIFSLGLNSPIQYFTWLLRNSECEDGVIDSLSSFEETLKIYKKVVNRKSVNNYYKKAYKHFFETHSRSFYDPEKLDKFGDYSKQMQNALIKLQNVPGIYFLYNSRKTLVYVGKSIDLASRIPSSINERNAHYFSYALTKSASDVGIYEMYYISMFKPKLNVEGKYPDELTVVLPELKREEISSVYKNKKSPAPTEDH
jgi:hypothetical protein